MQFMNMHNQCKEQRKIMNVKMEGRSVLNVNIPIQVTVLDMNVSEFSPQWHSALNEEDNTFVNR